MIVEEVVEVAVVVGVFKKPNPTLLALVQQFRFLWRDFQRTQKYPKFKSILNLWDVSNATVKQKSLEFGSTMIKKRINLRANVQ